MAVSRCLGRAVDDINPKLGKLFGIGLCYYGLTYSLPKLRILPLFLVSRRDGGVGASQTARSRGRPTLTGQLTVRYRRLPLRPA